MSIFNRKKVSVTVHGSTSISGGADGRYKKQAGQNKKAEKKHLKSLPLNPRTPQELKTYIEATYHVAPLPESDEIVMEAKELFKDVPNYDLTCYQLTVMQGTKEAAWLRVYVETTTAYLAFSQVALEVEETYSVSQIIKDLVRFFGAGKEDKKANNARYVQYISIC